MLLIEEYNKSIFRQCYLPRLSFLEEQDYMMHEENEGPIAMDQTCLQSKISTSVVRVTA